MNETSTPTPHLFDQWLLNALVGTPLNGPLSRGRYWSLRAIRELRLAISDPIVATCIGKSRLRLPLSHELPLYKRKFPDYALNLGRVALHVRHKYQSMTMIDVGANVGDSLAVTRTLSDHPVLCIEGEHRFFQFLVENTRHMPDVEVEHTFVGAAGDHIRAVRSERGNAQVLLGPSPGPRNIATLSETLARHPRFAAAKFVKLDAEGFDCRIIRAELPLLRRNRPVLFFEYYPHACHLTGQEPLSTFSVLSQAGYSTLLIYQNVGRYFMTLALDQVHALKDLHCFLEDLQGFCDVVAFHEDDNDIVVSIRAEEYANRAVAARKVSVNGRH